MLLAAKERLKALGDSIWKTIPSTLRLLSSTMMTFQNYGAECWGVLQELSLPCPMIPVFNLHLPAPSEQVTKEAVLSLTITLWHNRHHLHLILKGSLLSPNPSCQHLGLQARKNKSNQVNNKSGFVFTLLANAVRSPVLKMKWEEGGEGLGTMGSLQNKVFKKN